MAELQTLLRGSRIFFQDLLSNDDVSVAFDVTQLVAVKVDHELPQPEVGGSEVDFRFGVFTRSHRRAQPGR